MSSNAIDLLTSYQQLPDIPTTSLLEGVVTGTTRFLVKPHPAADAFASWRVVACTLLEALLRRVCCLHSSGANASSSGTAEAGTEGAIAQALADVLHLARRCAPSLWLEAACPFVVRPLGDMDQRTTHRFRLEVSRGMEALNTLRGEAKLHLLEAARSPPGATTTGVVQMAAIQLLARTHPRAVALREADDHQHVHWASLFALLDTSSVSLETLLSSPEDLSRDSTTQGSSIVSIEGPPRDGSSEAGAPRWARFEECRHLQPVDLTAPIAVVRDVDASQVQLVCSVCGDPRPLESLFVDEVLRSAIAKYPGTTKLRLFGDPEEHPADLNWLPVRHERPQTPQHTPDQKRHRPEQLSLTPVR